MVYYTVWDYAKHIARLEVKIKQHKYTNTEPYLICKTHLSLTNYISSFVTAQLEAIKLNTVFSIVKLTNFCLCTS